MEEMTLTGPLEGDSFHFDFTLASLGYSQRT
jgi:hypothetical protein